MIAQDRKFHLRKIASACEGRQFPISVADPSLPDCPLVYVNGAFEAVTGYTIADCVGRNCRFLQGDMSGENEVSELSRAVRSNQPVSTCLLNYRKDGTPFQNLVYIRPLSLPDGPPLLLGFQNEYTGNHPEILASQGNPGFVDVGVEVAKNEHTSIKMVREAVEMRVDSAIMVIETQLAAGR